MDYGHNFSDKHAETASFLEDNFRGFDFSEVAWTSDPTPWENGPGKVQNCFGFAMNSMKFWQPPSIHGDTEGDPMHHWPLHLLKGGEANTWVDRYVEAAKDQGFEDCGADSSCEIGFEKIVLIHSGGVFKHAAVQISLTRWKSKLGLFSDFEHSPECLVCNPFGKGVTFMKRKLAVSTPVAPPSPESMGAEIAQNPPSNQSV